MRRGASDNFIPDKGRIERLFGTFQDRLVVELRLAHARTLPEAQRVLDRLLPTCNARFAQPPAQPTPAWRPAPARAALERACCFKYRRTVQHDNTVQLDGRLIQLRPGPGGRSFAGTRVDVHAHLDGTIAVSYRGQPLAATRLPRGHRPTTLPQDRVPPSDPCPATPLPSGTQAPPATIVPPADHPWRRTFLTSARRKQLHDQGVTFS